jgi:hypothetical protein
MKSKLQKTPTEYIGKSISNYCRLCLELAKNENVQTRPIILSKENTRGSIVIITEMINPLQQNK